MYFKYTGVPKTMVKNSVVVPNYPLSSRIHNNVTRRAFYWGLIGYTLLFGTVGGFLFTDSSFFENDLVSRPDLMEFRAMVHPDYIPIKEKKALEMMHGSYFGQSLRKFDDVAWYAKFLRKLFPYYQYNPDQLHTAPFFDYTKDYQSTDCSDNYHL